MSRAVLVCSTIAVLAIAPLALAPSGLAAAPAAWCGTDQSGEDRQPEAVAGPQVHVIYATPSDQPDASGRWDAQIVGDLTEIDGWWRSQDPARTPRFDLYPFPNCAPGLGQLDISNVRLSATAADLRSLDVRYQRITVELRARFSSRFEKYLVYYDGPVDDRTSSVCGQASGDFRSGPDFAVLFLQADCGTFGVPSSVIAAHEFIHSLGALPAGAPHACPRDLGHPCDSPSDILYPQVSGGVELASLVLDVGHDDYYGHPGSWPDLQDSAWLLRVGTQTPLTVTVNGAGRIESDAPGLSCTAACTTSWDAGSIVSLSATPAAGQRFAGWSGGPCAGRGDCSLTIDAPKTVTGLFVKDVWKLQVKVAGKGRVFGGGISCPSRCSAIVQGGKVVTMSAVPAKGWRLMRWAGPCTTSRVRCAMPVNAATTLRARFVRTKRA